MKLCELQKLSPGNLCMIVNLAGPDLPLTKGEVVTIISLYFDEEVSPYNCRMEFLTCDNEKFECFFYSCELEMI